MRRVIIALLFLSTPAFAQDAAERELAVIKGEETYERAESLEDAHIAAVKTVESIEEVKALQAAFIINEFLNSIDDLRR